MPILAGALRGAATGLAVGIGVALLTDRGVVKRISIHEAGHALVARRAIPEFAIDHMALYGNPFIQRKGHVRFGGFSFSFDVPRDGVSLGALLDPDELFELFAQHGTSRMRWGYLAMALGGIASEVVHGVLNARELSRGTGYLADLGLARRFAASLEDGTPPWPHDPKDFTRDDDAVDFSSEAHPRAMRAAYVEGKRIVLRESPAVGRLATRLLTERVMDGASVVAVLDGT